MKNSQRYKMTRRLLVLGAVVSALMVPLMSRAQPQYASITIVNNSTREIRHVFLSHVNADDWSADQLNNSTIQAGQTYTLQNVSCDQQQVKVIGEDQDGCFLSAVVACGNATWTITNETVPDCGLR